MPMRSRCADIAAIARTFCTLWCALFVVGSLTIPAHAEKRVALVIGNAEYVEATPLRNPVNDAVALGASLDRLGFEVFQGLDLDLPGMRALIRRFGKQVDGAKLALFFYAGHGVQVNGKNYLLPVDAKLEEEADLDFSAIEVNLVMRQMDRAANTKLVLLDACRNNPFERALSRSMGATRSAAALGRGLARINASGGSMIAFATDPGAVAFDGAGQNSPFTEALLKHIATPGLEVNVMMTRVRGDVFASTGQKQRPWTSSSLIGEVYLVPGDAQPPSTSIAAPAPDRSETALEIAIWTSAEKGGSIDDYNSYLARYPDGAFSEIARLRLAALDPPATAGPTASDSQPESAAEQEAALDLDRAARREVQERLSVLGHDPRGLDGVFGPGSRQAIAAWQTSIGATATGYLTRDGLAELNRSSQGKLAAFRAEQRKRAAAAAAAAARQQPRTGTPSGSRTTGDYRARAVCNSVTGTGRHADRQQAMLLAARQCAARGGSPACCTSGISVTR